MFLLYHSKKPQQRATNNRSNAADLINMKSLFRRLMVINSQICAQMLITTHR